MGDTSSSDDSSAGLHVALAYRPLPQSTARTWVVVALGFLIIAVGAAYIIVPLGVIYRTGLYYTYYRQFASLIIVVGVSVVFFAAYRRAAARDRFYAIQEVTARREADEALNELSGSSDLISLTRANRKQMDAYDALARSQAATSYRASQTAMMIGLAILATGVAVIIFSHSDATKYAAAIITAVGAATGGFIGRTFINVHLHAAQQMNYYFRQPLVQSYLLSAERLVSHMPVSNEKRVELFKTILTGIMAQVEPTHDSLVTTKTVPSDLLRSRGASASSGDGSQSNVS